MKTGLISVILPVWKPVFTQLETCIDSILRQTYSNLELIIVYKKSPDFDDKFFNVISKISDERLKIIIDKNEGFPSQLNLGIKNSSGEFIARIDGDDYCEIERFEKQLEFKKKNKFDVVGSFANYISEDGKKVGIFRVPLSHDEIRRMIMLRNTMIHPAILMDRKIFDYIGLYDSSFEIAEDYEFWLRAMSKGLKFGNIPEPLVNVRINPNSVTRGNWKRDRAYTLKAKNKAIFHYGFHRPRDIASYIPTIFYYFISKKNAKRIRKILNIKTGE